MSENRAMPCDTNLFDRRFTLVFYPNLFFDDLRFLPLALIFVLVGIVRIELLDVEVFHVRDGIGDTPGDMLVVSDHDSWGARETCAHHIDIARHQVAFKPDGGDGLTE